MRPFKAGESPLNLIRQTIPDFVEADYPLFVEFVSAFIRFLDKKRETTSTPNFPEFGAPGAIITTNKVGGPLNESRHLLDYRDASTTIDEFISHFIEMYGKSFPHHTFVSNDLLMQSLRQFYKGKGTQDSIKWFFRVLFNEDSDVYFPREDIIRASDGTWSAPTTLKVSQALDGRVNADVFKFYVGQRIVTDTGTALVENVITTVVGQNFNQNIIVNELFLKQETILGSFSPNQILKNIDSTTQVRTRILPVITDLVVATGGSNYIPGDIITFSEGPSGGQGYGAFGSVKLVSNSSIANIEVLSGGDGYITGLPVTFTSTTGTGAKAEVSEIIYGDFLLEDNGFMLNEEQSASSTDFLVLEDKNTLDVELLIEPFVNAISNIIISGTDYGTVAGVPQMVGVGFDSTIDIALAAVNTKPFMHPWVFTNALQTTAALANAAASLTLSTNTFFSNTQNVFAISDIFDTATTFGTANITANVIVSDTTSGNNVDILYLQGFTGFDRFDVGVILKASGNGVLQLGSLTTNGTANIVGTGTNFTQTLKGNTHIRLQNGTHVVVKSVVNNTFLTTYTPIAANLVTNTFSIVATGRVDSITPQAQRFYGKIKSVRLLSNGQKYLTPPAVAADSISARAQELFYLEEAFTNTAHIVSAASQISVFQRAFLRPAQNAGQIVKVNILNSGVNYSDPDHVGIQAIHGSGRMGANAVFTPVIGALTKYPGIFTTSRGFLSSDKYLQDATYYNDFTYVVRVAQSFGRYKEILLKLIHPAGFKLLGAFVLVLEATLDFNSTDLIPVFEPISRNALLASDNLYVLDDPIFRMALELGESVDVGRTRTVTASQLAQTPEFSRFLSARDYYTSTDYEMSLFGYGLMPRIHWSLTDTAGPATSTGSLNVNGTYGTVTSRTDDAPTYPIKSVELTTNTGAIQYVFADANAELFQSRTVDGVHERGALAIWYKPSTLPASGQRLIFGDENWLNLRVDANGAIYGYIGATLNVMSSIVVTNQQWHLLVVSFKGLVTDSLMLHVDGRMQNLKTISTGTFIPRTITIGSSNTSIANSALGQYGQATVLNAVPMDESYWVDLYASGFRDGTETLSALRFGKGTDLIYPFNGDAISTLSSNTILSHTMNDTPLAEVLELLAPASGLS